MARKVLKVSARAHSKAPPEAVWRLLADGGNWDQWARMSESKLARKGDDQRNGIGAIRRFRTGRIVTREEVIAFDPPRHLAYRLLSGMPVKDYRADVELTPAGGGTDITWTSVFFPSRDRISLALRVWIALVLRDYSRRLAKAAAKSRAA